MQKKNLADILWSLVILTALLMFLTSFVLSLKSFNTIIDRIFIIPLLFIPYLKKSNIWTKIIAFLGFVYTISFIMHDFFAVSSHLLRPFIVIPTFLAYAIFFINLFAPNFLSGDKKVKVADDDEFTLAPGPYRRHPFRGMIIHFLSQYILTLLNPFQLYQAICVIIGNMRAEIRQSKINFIPADFNQKVEYSLPFTGEWIVFNGGIKQEHSHSWDILTQRYAYDFIKIDSAKSSHRNSGNDLADYYCYGESIVAPADGVVVDLKTNIRDAKKPGTMKIDFLARDIRGNYVVIKHAEKEYSFMAHFIPNSIAVKKGQHVKKHQLIGKCGNSGYSTEPHLHFHIQDHPNVFFAIGIPIKFSNLEINGEKFQEAYIQRGDEVKI